MVVKKVIKGGSSDIGPQLFEITMADSKETQVIVQDISEEILGRAVKDKGTSKDLGEGGKVGLISGGSGKVGAGKLWHLRGNFWLNHMRELGGRGERMFAPCIVARAVPPHGT